MAKTYDASQLSSSTVYQIRLAIGDHLANRMVLDDDEISFIVTTNTTNAVVDKKGAAIACCESAIATLANDVSYSKSKISEQMRERLQNFMTVRDNLMKGADLFKSKGYTTAGMFAGGINLSDIDELDDNTGLRQPSFKKSEDKHPGSPIDTLGNFDDPQP